MKKARIFTAVLLALCLCLAGASALAEEEEDFSEIAGVWYTEEIEMSISEEGRFVLGWNDGDWAGSLEKEPWANGDEPEYTAYRMILDDPEQSMWESLELVPDLSYPGKITYYQDGTPLDAFYNVPVCVAEPEEEELAYYEPYAFIDDADGEEPAVTMMFTLLRPAADVAVMRMTDQEIDEDGELAYNAETLEWWAELDGQERIVVKHVFEGDLPDLLISFAAEDEVCYNYAVQISGEDGTLFLMPLLPSNG